MDGERERAVLYSDRVRKMASSPRVLVTVEYYSKVVTSEESGIPSYAAYRYSRRDLLERGPSTHLSVSFFENPKSVIFKCP